MKSKAILTIKNLPSMKQEEVDDIAEWLRANADSIQTSPNEFSKLFRARYHD